MVLSNLLPQSRQANGLWESQLATLTAMGTWIWSQRTTMSIRFPSRSATDRADFHLTSTITVGFYPVAVVVADFNLDGELDVVTANTGD